MRAKTLKLVTVVGTRPQFIKAAPVSRALAEAGHQEVLVHTGQHYDSHMSAVFFDELKLPMPAYDLGVGSGTHAEQVGRGLIQLAPILVQEKPDVVLVYGDTNATLTGALAASQLGIPIAHVEAGLRSYNRLMIEETNRVICDHMATWRFCPTEQAVLNLKKEGVNDQVYACGDVMLDAHRLFSSFARNQSSAFLKSHGLVNKSYVLLTLHRAETTLATDRLMEVLRRLDEFSQQRAQPVLFPAHPRLATVLAEMQAQKPFAAIRPVPPLGYLQMLLAEENARVILTDSGGIQKEAAFAKVPCVTLRDETEWVETVASGWNVLTGLVPEKILHALSLASLPSESIVNHYGDGHASKRIVEILSQTA